MLICVWYVVLTFESVDEILYNGMTIQMTPLQQYFHAVILIFKYPGL